MYFYSRLKMYGLTSNLKYVDTKPKKIVKPIRIAFKIKLLAISCQGKYLGTDKENQVLHLYQMRFYLSFETMKLSPVGFELNVAISIIVRLALYQAN